HGLCALQHLRVGDGAPVAAVIALGDEDAVRRLARPVLEAVGQPLRIGLQRLGGTQHHGAVSTPLDARLQAAPDADVAVPAHDFPTFPALPSRNARMRSLAASSPWAMAAISDSTKSPSDCA